MVICTAYNYNQPMWCWELSIDWRERDSRDLFEYGMWVKMLLNLAVMLYFFNLELSAPTAATSHDCKRERERAAHKHR